MNRGRPSEVICQCGNGEISGLKTNEINSKHEWREMMTEHEQCFCFFNQEEFREKLDEMNKVRGKIKDYSY